MTGIEKALHILATQGRAALQSHAEAAETRDRACLRLSAAALQSHAEAAETAETAVQDILLAGRGLGLRDLRDELIFNLFRRISFEQAAQGLGAALDKRERAEDLAMDAERDYWEARDDYARDLLVVSGYVRSMNKAVDQAEFLCGTGIDASAFPPSTTKAIDDLINARGRLSRSAEKMRAAETRARKERQKLAVLQHQLSALVVATGPSTEI